jgi:putative flippase GtrA
MTVHRSIQTHRPTRTASVSWLSQRLRQYLVYFIVGGFVGALSIAFRELVGLMLPEDNPVWYVVSVGIAYGTAILLSFSLHSRVTFAGALKGRNAAVPLGKFGIIATIGLIASAALAPAMRYGLHFDAFFGPRGGLWAFVLASVLVSLLSCALNALFTFRPGSE